MDTITNWALSINDATIKTISWDLNNNVIYGVLLLALVLMAENRNTKRLKIIIALAITFLAVSAIKLETAHTRPCVDEAWCPVGYSFPSSHAALAFTLMLAFLNKKSYPLFVAFALIVCFTRLNIGVHVFEDVAGALPFALLSYYVTDVGYERGMEWIKNLKGRFSTSA